MTQEALKALIHEMEYVLSCINEEKIPFDGDDFHEALRLGKEALAQTEQERPADCERCNRLEEQAYDLVGKLRVANIKLSMQPQRTWVGSGDLEDSNAYLTTPQRTWVKLMRGVRVEGDSVVILVKGGNEAARELCNELLKEKNT